MPLSTGERDQIIAIAIQYYDGWNGIQEPEPKPVSLSRVSQLFGPDRTTLYRRIHNITKTSTHGGQNRILTPVQETTVLTYIQRQYECGFPADLEMIEAAVTHFRELEGKPSPLYRWVKEFMKRHGPKFNEGFKKIKWKPMDRKQRAAQDSETIIA